MTTKIKIIGAGLTGMIAAHIFPQAKVYESNTLDKMTPHKALLRFRSNAVEEVTGIPFRQVTVRKGIWGRRPYNSHGCFIEPSIQAANAYSLKCTGKILPRSIWDIAPCQRWIAPDDFIELLQENLVGRIEYGKAFDFKSRADMQELFHHDFNPVISTVPMGIVAQQIKQPMAPEFSFRPVKVYRLDLGDDYDVHQTVYFPFSDTSVYRASITGSMLIVEVGLELGNMNLQPVIDAFHLPELSLDDFSATSQRYGKIAPIDDGWRRNFIHWLSDTLGIYSLGRFGTWRNILLDDTVHDCAVIKRLMFSDSYTKGMVRAK